MRLKKRAFCKFTFPTRSNVQHPHNRGDVWGDCETGCDGFCCVFKQCENCIHIQIKIIGYICCDTTPCKPADIAQRILKFGKVRAQNLEYADLNLKNGDLEMENSSRLRLSSSGTEMDINSVKSLEIYSNKDDILIGEIGSVNGSLKFSTLNMQRLIKEVNLDAKIADFRVTQFIESESKISIEQESSEITLYVSGFSHKFSATLEQGVVRLPKSFENVNSTMLDKGRRLREIEATYGNDQKGLISINGIKGIVTINE